jgi:CRP-like cAMP-binding protein
MKTYCFFAHVAFAKNARAHATPQSTANLLLEVDETTLIADCKKRRPKLSDTDVAGSRKVELAGKLAKAAALAYLKSEPEFRRFPARRFVNFDHTSAPTHISICPSPSKVLPNGSKVWRLAQSEADQLRGEPLSTHYPGIERRLAAHRFLKGMSRHHVELLALCATPTEFDKGQIIFREGDPANGFYLLETGSVALEGKRKGGQPVVIDTVSAGEPLGWSWLFPPYIWEFDARATKACQAICLSGIMLRQHRDEDLTLSHELHKRVSEVMVRRLQAARSKLIGEHRPSSARRK